jgi:hypothetical protein
MTDLPNYTFGYAGRIVNWTVPTTGYFQIVACGGEGGKNGGLGAEVGGDIELQAGQTLQVLVGNTGDPMWNPGVLGFAGGGGGGGSFVVGANNTPLVIAGGGTSHAQHSAAGIRFRESPNRCQDGTVNTSGNRGFGSQGGTNGSGGSMDNSFLALASGAGGGSADRRSSGSSSRRSLPSRPEPKGNDRKAT